MAAPPFVDHLECLRCGRTYRRGLDGPCPRCGPEGVLDVMFDVRAAGRSMSRRSLKTRAKDICSKLSIPDARRVHQLTDDEVLKIRELIDRDFVVEGDLRREQAMNIKRLMDLGCYRGLRHRKGLPVRGQRTHTNARTRKGKARPIAGKKK